MVEALTGISVLVGSGALALGIYSHFKRRETERQLKDVEQQLAGLEGQLEKKQELREMAGHLDDVKFGLSEIVDILEKPDSYGDPDLWNQIRSASKDCITAYHAVNTPPNVYVAGVTIRADGDEQTITDSEEVLEEMKDGVMVWPRLKIRHERAEGYSYEISGCFWNHSYAYDGLFTLYDDHEGVLNQFDSELLSDTESILDDILVGIAENLLASAKGKTFNPDDYEDVEQLAISIFKNFIWYEGIEDDLDDASVLIERIEDIRKTTLQASYS